jgi:excinuclease ABC subunit A
MALREIRVYGANEHNLKNIDVAIPRQSLTVITGLSGSGKSSLAFDTIYAEGQRRYIESLSAYARQYLDQLPKPHVEKIEGLSPAVSIEQKTVNRNPRSTVGTVTEIHDYLRLLFATIGHPACPHCGHPLVSQNAESITRQILALLPAGTRLEVMAPVVRGRKGEYQALFQKLLRDGFTRAKIDGERRDLDPSMRLRKQFRHDIAVVVDRLYVNDAMAERLRAAIDRALAMAEGLAIIETLPDKHGAFDDNLPWKGERLFSQALGCPEHGPQVVDLAPRVFSFNSPYGWCPECEGLGTIPEVDVDRIVPNPALSLARGAVLPWAYFFRNVGSKQHRQLVDSSQHARQLFALIEAAGIDINTPWCELSAQHREWLVAGFRGGKPPRELAQTRKKGAVDLTGWHGVAGRIQKKLAEVEDDEEYSELSAYLRQRTCPACQGTRLRPEALSVTLGGRHIAAIASLGIVEAIGFFDQLQLSEREALIAQQPLREVRDRLGFLRDVGLGYLTLDRSSATLSGGEAQRIRLATQIGSRLTGVLYVLDEPSIGLHQRDNQRLINALLAIRDRGNTVLVVEHDEQTIRAADWVVDLGPGAGTHGGTVLASGPPSVVAAHPESPTGRFLRGHAPIARRSNRRTPGERRLRLEGCRLHNLRDVTLDLPLGLMVGVCGVSGSGKSSLIMQTLLPALMNHCYKASHQVVGPHRGIFGLEHVDRCIHVDQQPIGRTPRSNPATYTKLFDSIREVFANTSDARIRGFEKGRFSFNVAGGRCEECKGQGMVKVEMSFLPDVYVECESCNGRRYNSETLEVRHRGRNIAEVLDMTVEEALAHFEAMPMLSRPLQALADVGLSYIRLGQAATTLSGGEAQRIKLARELAKRNTERTVYILDEPTTGLHFADVSKLLEVLDKLVEQGATVVIIEHNLDVLAACDWLIDMGPEAGSEGGCIVAQGPPEAVAAVPESVTGRFLPQPAPTKSTKAKRTR